MHLKRGDKNAKIVQFEYRDSAKGSKICTKLECTIRYCTFKTKYKHIQSRVKLQAIKCQKLYLLNKALDCKFLHCSISSLATHNINSSQYYTSQPW